MRKTAAALASTAAGLAAVLALHSVRQAVPLVGATAPPSSTSQRSSSRTTSTSTSPSSTQAGGRSRVLGASEQYGFGVLSVRVTATGHRIDNVSVATLQTAESYSQSLAQEAIPILRNEVLAAQSARVNAVSGATYTSEAYLYSLQSALDKLPQ
jgi:uncharacterized protein with FMN-binding domain